MLSRVNGAVWLEEGGEGEEEEATSWPRLQLDPSGEAKDEMGLPSFKSMLEDDWFAANSSYNQGGFEALPIHPDIRSIGFHSDPFPAPEAVLLPPPVGSSSTCSPSSVFTLDASQPFLASKTALSSLFSSVCSAPFDAGFDLGCEASGFLQPLQMSTSPVLMGPAAGHMGCTDLSPGAQFPGLLPAVDNGSTSGAGASFQQMGFENSPFLNRSKVLRPLEIFPSVGAQPTLFQKRAAALRQSSVAAGEMGGSLRFLGSEGGEKWRRGSEEDKIDDASVDGSGLNYDSDDVTENAKGEESTGDGSGRGNNSNANSAVTGGAGGDRKGKKKGLPAKNLMAERRRRKKLNDRLFMLRSVVPKISKMDRASILGDAIEYLKELLQRINDLHNELEPTPPTSSLLATNSTSFHPLTPTPSTLPCRVKEELCPSSLPSPNSQPPRVEVQVREGRAVKIHMFCARRPGLLLSTMRALDSLDIDIQQAVISCFNGFALDVFRAEQCKDGPGVLPEEIKAVLLQSAGFRSVM